MFDAASILAGKNESKIKLKIIGATELKDGGGGEDYVRQLINRASNLDVEWMGAIYDPNKLAEEISHGDCFVYPSVAQKGETFGVAPLEAMALGVPVVLSDLKCFSDFAEAGINSLQFTIGEGAAERLVKAIEWLMSNPAEARCLAKKGAKTATLFSKVEIANKYEKLFKIILREDY